MAGDSPARPNPKLTRPLQLLNLSFTAFCYHQGVRQLGLSTQEEEREATEKRMIKKLAALIGVVALIVTLGVLATGGVFAQSTTPSTPETESVAPDLARGLPGGRSFGFFGHGGIAEFDAVAEALNMDPTQLFEAWHSGKTLSEIAEAQGVDLTKVQEDLQAARVQARKDAITQAVTDGKMTQDQADWLLKGMENGWTRGVGRPGGRGRMDGRMGVPPATESPTSFVPGIAS